MHENNLVPGRAYHVFEQFGAWQGLPCNRIECLHPSGLISFCARQGLPCNRTVWHPAGLTMQFMYYFVFLPYLRLAGLTMQ